MKLFLVVCMVIAMASGTKFCPKEKNGDECKSKSQGESSNGKGSYKCGVFLERPGASPPIAWLGALPDALNKKSVKKDDIEEILGKGVDKESFGKCTGDPVTDKIAANARCYAIMKKMTDEPLDSCDKNALVTKGDDTVGNYLCGQVKRWGLSDEPQVVFYYSTCGGDWEKVTDSDPDTGSPLKTSERLCCDGRDFKRCANSEFPKKWNRACN